MPSQANLAPPVVVLVVLSSDRDIRSAAAFPLDSPQAQQFSGEAKVYFERKPRNLPLDQPPAVVRCAGHQRKMPAMARKWHEQSCERSGDIIQTPRSKRPKLATPPGLRRSLWNLPKLVPEPFLLL